MNTNCTNIGLSSQEVEQRKSKGYINNSKKIMTKSYKHIFFENIFSLFNFVNLIIFLILLYVGSIKNCLFMLVVFCNTCIGIIQEIRSKRIIDKLSIVNQTAISVMRDGCFKDVAVEELVSDDIIELSSGCQIPNDCIIVENSCEVNEALITGESESISKSIGDKLLSGSYVVSGKCLCRVTGVGDNNYADSILGQIKYVKKCSSEIVRVIKRIILIISICIVPLSILLFYNQYTLSHSTFSEAVISSAAAIIGMIPEGLVLLITTVFAISVIRLSRKNVLSQDLYSIENLARTDVLCLDKTGTITTGEMKLHKLVPIKLEYEDRLKTAVLAITSLSSDTNNTISAIREKFQDKTDCKKLSEIPFSSERKWSAVTTDKYGTFAMGAAEMLVGGDFDYAPLTDEDKTRYRIITVVHTDRPIVENKLDNIEVLGYILLSEKIRESIGETINYFKAQGVDIKVISGDNPNTVSRLCDNILEKNKSACVDMSKIPDEKIPETVEKNTVFGRVTPVQKKMIVAALKANGHTVGMIGDGVNDVLALKESDCSIGLANGSEAARNVSHLVLLDSDFSSLPSIVSEGRRSINNLQNSATLFLAKTIFSALMTLIFMFINFPYPFAPIQMTLISALTIGMPSFILSLMQNNKRFEGSFIINVIRKSLPAAMTNVFTVIMMVLFGEIVGLSDVQISTVCVLVLAVTGVLLIIHTYKPLSPMKITVLIMSISGLLLAFAVFGSFFGFTVSYTSTVSYMLFAVAFDVCIFVIHIWLFSVAAPQRKYKEVQSV